MSVASIFLSTTLNYEHQWNNVDLGVHFTPMGASWVTANQIWGALFCTIQNTVLRNQTIQTLKNADKVSTKINLLFHDNIFSWYIPRFHFTSLVPWCHLSPIFSDLFSNKKNWITHKILIPALKCAKKINKNKQTKTKVILLMN